MPVTMQFIAGWFIFSAMIFFLEGALFRSIYHAQPDRDDNTLMILLAQGLGALLAYAIH